MRIEHHGQFGRLHALAPLGCRPVPPAQEFLPEILQPRFQYQPLRFELVAPGQIEHVADDAVGPLDVVVNDLR